MAGWSARAVRDRPQSPAAELVLAGIDELEAQYAIDLDRIYLTGASAGGAGTWDLITRKWHRTFRSRRSHHRRQ